MDLSRWYNINPSIKIVETTKKFYSKYLYKIVYELPGVSLLPYTRNEEHFLYKIATYESRRWGGYRPATAGHLLSTETAVKLLLLYKVYSGSSDLRFRTEGHNISIFSNNLDYLYEIATVNLSGCSGHITTVSMPLSQYSQDILEEDYIIVRTPTDYLYRVNLKNGWSSKTDIVNLANYLEVIKDEVKVTQGFLEDLKKQHKYLTGRYFYVRDPKLVDMLVLIAPLLILSIQKLKVIQK